MLPQSWTWRMSAQDHCRCSGSVVCHARKSTHPNRQYHGVDPLWGNPNPWITVHSPAAAEARRKPRVRRQRVAQPQDPPPQPSQQLSQVSKHAAEHQHPSVTRAWKPVTNWRWVNQDSQEADRQTVEPAVVSSVSAPGGAHTRTVHPSSSKQPTQHDRHKANSENMPRRDARGSMDGRSMSTGHTATQLVATHAQQHAQHTQRKFLDETCSSPWLPPMATHSVINQPSTMQHSWSITTQQHSDVLTQTTLNLHQGMTPATAPELPAHSSPKSMPLPKSTSSNRDRQTKTVQSERPGVTMCPLSVSASNPTPISASTPAPLSAARPVPTSEAVSAAFTQSTSRQKPVSVSALMSAAQVLNKASRIAALAGPIVGLRGVRLRTRLAPIDEQRFAGVFGQTRQAWWRWRQWVRTRRRERDSITGAAVAAEPPHDVMMHDSSGRGFMPHARTTAAPAMPTDGQVHDAGMRDYDGSGVGGVPHLTALTMDDVSLDLDELEEGITEDMLRRSQEEIQLAIATNTWNHLKRLASCRTCHPHHHSTSSPHADQHQQGVTVPLIRIFKGGGYIAADLVAMLRVTGLDKVMGVQVKGIKGAHCILAMERWKNGHPVNLIQHKAAADNRHIPLLLTQSLKAHDVLLALRPLLIEMGLVPAFTGNKSRKVIHLTNIDPAVKPTRGRQISHAGNTQRYLKPPSMVSSGPQHETRVSSVSPVPGSWDDTEQLQMLQSVAAGRCTVAQYVQKSRL